MAAAENTDTDPLPCYIVYFHKGEGIKHRVFKDVFVPIPLTEVLELPPGERVWLDKEDTVYGGGNSGYEHITILDIQVHAPFVLVSYGEGIYFSGSVQIPRTDDPIQHKLFRADEERLRTVIATIPAEKRKDWKT